MRKSLAYKLVIVLLSSSLLWFFAQFVSAAWQDATEDFPGGVPAAPLDTSSLDQSKTGGVSFGDTIKTKIENGRIWFNAAGSPTGQIYWYGGKLMAREGTSAWQLAVDKAPGCGTATTGKIWWDSTNSKFVCGTDGGDSGPGGGITTINGQTGPSINIVEGSPNVAISAFDKKIVISVTGGSGTGDIGAVLTGSGSGLVGGADSGDVNLSLDKSAISSCTNDNPDQPQKIYWNGTKLACGADQTGSGTGNIIDTLSATLTAGNDAGGQNAINFGRVSAGVASFDDQYRITTTGGGIKAENNDASDPAGYFKNSNASGISLTVDGKIKITGGNPSAGKVLTSVGTDGSANWQAAAGGGQWQPQSGTSNIFYNTGKVGVGTNDPQALFDVKGNLRIGGEYNQPSYSLILGIGAVDEYGPPSGQYQSSPGDDTTPADDTVNPFNDMCASYTGTYTDWFKVFDANGDFIGYISQPVICRIDSNIYKVRNNYGTVEFLNSADDVKASLGQNGHLTVASCTGCGSSGTSQWNDTSGGIFYNGGNVGIGTTAPAGKLTVAGGYAASGLTGAGNQLHISASGATPNAAQIVWGDNTGWKLHFGTKVTGTFTERMTIVDTGNVGIGTTNPTAKLTIGGTAGVDGIKFPDGTLQTTAGGGSGGGWTDDGAIVRLNNPSDSVALGRDGITNLVTLAGFKGSGGETRFDINPMTINSSASSTVTFFRNINTTGEKSLIMFAGNGAADRVNRFSVNGASWIDGGSLGIKTRTPQATLDVNGNAKINAGLDIGGSITVNPYDMSIVLRPVNGLYQEDSGWSGGVGYPGDNADTCYGGTNNYDEENAFFCGTVQVSNCTDYAYIQGSNPRKYNSKTTSCYVPSTGTYTIKNSSNNLVFVNGSGQTKFNLEQNGTLNIDGTLNINDKFFVDSSGNVRIGTTGSQAKLNINGPIKISTSSDSCSSNNRGSISFTTGDNYDELYICVRNIGYPGVIYEWRRIKIENLY